MESHRSESLLAELKARFPEWIDPQLSDVLLMRDSEGFWIREVRRRGDAARSVTDWNLDTLSGFDANRPFSEARELVLSLDAAILLNTTDVFNPDLCPEIASREGLTEGPVRSLLAQLLHGLRSPNDEELLASLRRVAMVATDLSPAEQRFLVPVLLRLMRHPRSTSTRLGRAAPGMITYNDPWDDGWLAADALSRLSHPDAERALFEFFASIVRTIHVGSERYAAQWSVQQPDRALLLAEWFPRLERVAGPLDRFATIVVRYATQTVSRYFAKRSAQNSRVAVWLAQHHEHSLAGSLFRVALDSLGLAVYYQFHPADAEYIGDTGSRGQMLHAVLDPNAVFRKFLEHRIDRHVQIPGVVGSGTHVLRCLAALYEATSRQVHGQPPPAGREPTADDWATWTRWSEHVFAAILIACLDSLEAQDRDDLEALLPKALDAIRAR